MRDESGNALPYLEEQTILIVQNQDTELLKFMAGETHLLNPRPEDVPTLRERAPTLGINVQEVGLDSGALFVVFNRNPNHYERNGSKGSAPHVVHRYSSARPPTASTRMRSCLLPGFRNAPWPTSPRRTRSSTIPR
jgi:hypothetical protein